MAYRNLQQFVRSLAQTGDLVEIEAPVDPYLEVAEIHRRVIAAGGPALLFRNVKGSSFPVVTNLFGTKARVDRAFGGAPGEFIAEVAKLPETMLPPSIGKLWSKRRLLSKLARIGFKHRQGAPVLTHQIAGADLTKLPAITSWIEDGGPFLTLPLVHTHSPTGKPDNLGMYRVQIFDTSETGMHFQIGKGGGFHLYEAEQAGVPVDTNIYLGGPPALILSAIAPLPENVPELLLASLVMGGRVDRAKTSAAVIPPVAEAEFCLVGQVPPGVRRPEGPFGDHYGYYSLKHDYPVFRPKAIYHRKDAVFPATVVGKPRQEDFYIGDYLQELLSPLFPVVMPGVVDLWSYGETGYHSLSGAILKERYGRETMSSVFRILGEGQLSLTKFLLATDQPVDLKDFRATLECVLARTRPETDLFIFPEVSMDTLDYAGPEVNKGSKGVLLGLGEPKRQLPGEIGSIPSGTPIRDARVFCRGALVVEVPGYEQDRDCVAALASIPELAPWPLIIAVDNAAAASSTSAAFLWTTFTRFNPASDVHSGSSQIVQNRIDRSGPIVIDARMKPWYPDELFCDPETEGLVTRRWQEYFPKRSVEMGDSRYGHLPFK